jgi:Amidohydrolase
MSSQVETRSEVVGDTVRSVELVDCDVHAQATEAMLAGYLSVPARRLLERYGRRTPRVTEWYPRARHSGMRVDAWPGKPGHIWGSDPELTREQLLDEFDVDYAVLEVLSGQDCYDHPDFAAEWNSAVNQWQLDEWLSFDSRFRGTIAVPHEYADLAVAEIERRAGDERFRGRAAARERRRTARRGEVLADLRGRDRARPAGRFPHRRLRRSPRSGLSLVLPRVPRRERDRHAEPAREHGRRRDVRRHPWASGGADRVQRWLGRRRSAGRSTRAGS